MHETLVSMHEEPMWRIYDTQCSDFPICVSLTQTTGDNLMRQKTCGHPCKTCGNNCEHNSKASCAYNDKCTIKGGETSLGRMNGRTIED